MKYKLASKTLVLLDWVATAVREDYPIPSYRLLGVEVNAQRISVSWMSTIYSASGRGGNLLSKSLDPRVQKQLLHYRSSGTSSGLTLSPYSKMCLYEEKRKSVLLLRLWENLMGAKMYPRKRMGIE